MLPFSRCLKVSPVLHLCDQSRLSRFSRSEKETAHSVTRRVKYTER